MTDTEQSVSAKLIKNAHQPLLYCQFSHITD